MPRTARIDRPVAHKVYLPTSLSSRLQLFLYSPLEQRIPHGALSTFIESLVREALDKVAAAEQKEQA